MNNLELERMTPPLSKISTSTENQNEFILLVVGVEVRKR